jgi:hypothetical protein
MLRIDVHHFEDLAKLISTLTSEDARAVAFSPLRPYARYLREELNGTGCGRCTDYGFNCSFDVDGTSVCIIGINSAWL